MGETNPVRPWIGLGMALVLWLLAGCTREAPVPDRPHLLLVTLDTTRADALGCYGASSPTPALDGLAARGARFPVAVANVPVTLPAHATIHTGSYPHHGARHNGRFLVPGAAVTLAERLSEAGYATSAVVASAVLDSIFGLDQGFDRYVDFDIDLTARPAGGNPPERRADEVTRLASGMLDGPRGRPLFLWVHYYDPHFPYDPPDPYGERHPDQPYHGEIAFMDAQIGELLARFDAFCGENPRLVVVVGDHGESLGEHREATHGMTLYEAAIRVPWIVSMEGVIPPGRVVESASDLADVVPTVLDLLRIEDRGEGPLHGRNHGTRLRRDSSVAPEPDDTSERFLYLETLYPRFGYGWDAVDGLRTERWKYVRAPLPELYDLVSDPEERRNLLTGTMEPSEEEARLLGRLEALLEECTSVHSLARLPAPVARAVGERLRALGYVEIPMAEDVGPRRGSRGRIPPPRDPKDLLDCAETARELEEFLEEERYAGVLEELDGMEEDQASRPFFLHLRTEALLGLERYDDAEQLCRRILDRNGRDPVASIRLAELTRASGDPSGADELLRNALRFGDGSWPIHAAAGRLLLRLERPREALDHFNRAETIAGKVTAEILLGRGRGYQALGDLDAAAAELLRAASRDPKDRGAMLALADVQVDRGKTTEAMNLLRPRIPPRGTDREATHIAVRALLAREDYRDAETLLDELIRLYPQDAEAYRLRGDLCTRRKWYRRARTAYSEAIRIEPTASGLAGLASLLLEAVGTPIHDPERAAGVAARAVGLDPARPDLLLLEARALHALDRDDEARDRLRRALDLGPRDPVPYRELQELLEGGR